jgi:secreted Zn-dependent insulinase-like peptidase
LIGHEGSGSLLTLLKKKGWANYLSAYCQGDVGFGFFSVSIDLTESGLGNYFYSNSFTVHRVYHAYHIYHIFNSKL